MHDPRAVGQPIRVSLRASVVEPEFRSQRVPDGPRVHRLRGLLRVHRDRAHVRRGGTVPH